MDKVQIPKLKNQSNWTVWKLQIESNLQYHGFEEILTGEIVKPEPLTEEPVAGEASAVALSARNKIEYEARLKLYKRTNGYAITLLTTSVEDEPLHLIEMYTTAKEMWDKLNTSYERAKTRKSLSSITGI